MDDGQGAAGPILFIVLLLLQFILYGFGMAIQVASSTKIREASQAGNPKAKKAEEIIDKPSGFVDTLQLLSVFIYLVMGSIVLSYVVHAFIMPSDLSAMPSAYACILAGILVGVLLYVFGIQLPKRIAGKYAWQWVMFWVIPLSALVKVCYPFVAILNLTTNLLARVFGVKKEEENSDVTEEEIISMVNEGHEQGVLQESEAQMITNIFEFTDKDAKDIMTHRSNIVGIDAQMPLGEAVEFMLKENNSRYPVYIDNIDHIIGILHLRDAFQALEVGKNDQKPVKSIRNLIREAKFIPETRNIDTLFRSMQSLKTHMVIVIDEYGQTAGLIAMEDILEEIVGNIFDEYDEDDQFILEKGQNVYEIDGLTPLEELGEKLEIDFSKEEFETLNGLLVSRLEHIPTEEDSFDMDYGGFNFKVLSVENKVIRNVLVTKLQDEKELTKEMTKKGEE